MIDAEGPDCHVVLCVRGPIIKFAAMSVWLAALHLINFVAPAFGVALLLALAEPIVKRKKPSALVLFQAFAMYFMAGAAVLMLGLALLARDGKMLTYTLLVVTLGSLAAWRTR